MKSAQVEQNFSALSKFLKWQALDFHRCALGQLWQINAIGNYANRIAHSKGANGLRFRFAQGTQARRVAQMRVFIQQRSDLFFPLCILQRPSFQHAMRMNDVWPPRPAMPLMRSNGAIFPQTVGGQNVEISANQSRHELI